MPALGAYSGSKSRSMDVRAEDGAYEPVEDGVPDAGALKFASLF